MIAQPQRTGVTVGYQGVPGSFSSQAMHQWFGKVDSHNYPKFEDVFVALKKGEIDYGVVPMENSSVMQSRYSPPTASSTLNQIRIPAVFFRKIPISGTRTM